MANSLLDFVMSIVRDPDAAARYAADPSQAIADAHLGDVTSVDVNNLIPVVSESLSMGAPAGHGADTPDHNVWASGAATAAFDAFADHVPEPAVADPHVVDRPVDHVIDHPLDPSPGYAADLGPEVHSFDAGFDQQMPTDEVHTADDVGAGPTDPAIHEHHVVDDHGFAAEHPGFDIF
ncbi:MAG: Rv0340 family protein [Mycobacteriaceae bacterium]|nr:Rv0340 family protein [Mycobacteriaceae bacterium]